jgi:hypothetical protein
VKVLVAAGIAALFLVATAGPSGADPAKPTDYRSEVTAIDPPTDAVTVEVVGGDGFLHLDVAPGHEVVVEGYREDPDVPVEPWLHIGADGTVEQNRNSAATYLNADRYASVPDPGVDPDAEPVWEVVGHEGEFVWHDHRIHWMSPEPPPNRSAGDTVFDDWQVPMTVDGRPVVVHGTLVWERDENPLVWAGVVVVALVVVAFAARRRGVLVAGAATAVAAALAVVVGLGQRAATPAAAGGTPLVVVIPAIALVTAVVAVAAHRRPAAVVALLASVASLLGWSLLRFQVLLHPVLPTDLPFAVDRLGTALAIGVGLSAAYAAVVSGALRPVDDDGE